MRDPHDPTRTVPPIGAVVDATRDPNPRATAEAPDPNAPAGALIHPPGTITALPGRYVLDNEIARGGMGAVYWATDTAFGREVAVKVLLDQFAPDSSIARRFHDEARITGQLQHPGIPPVFDLGTLPDGRPFLAMKLIKGHTLKDLLSARPDPASERGRFVAVFEQVCQALAYAHAHDVIHRDLKPANIMVGAFAEVQVMDWGLAKVLGGPGEERTESDDTAAGTAIVGSPRSDDSLTRTGSVLGTPAFMPPEQALGAIHEIDRRSDVFGLGAVFTVVLTGRPPFVSGSSESTRVMAARGDVTDCFARLDGCGADPELVALCKQCLAPKKEDRPRDAGEVAEAVARLRAAADERARQAELDRVTAEGDARTRRMAEEKGEEQRKRRRVQWALVASAALVLAATAVGVTLASLYHAAEGNRTEADLRRVDADRAKDEALSQKILADRATGDAHTQKRLAEDAQSRAEAAQRETEKARKDLEREREKLAAVEYGRTIQLALIACRDHDQAGARVLLDSTQARFRRWEWYYVSHLANYGLLRILKGHEGVVNAVSWNQDGTRVVTASDDGTAKVWDPNTGKEVLTLKGHTGQVNAVSWNPDGTRLVTAGDDKTARVWDTRTGNGVITLKGHADRVAAVAWSSDGTRIVTASDDKTALIWDTKTGAWTISINTGGSSTVCWSPDGTRVFIGGSTARVWDARTGAEVLELRGHTRAVVAVSWNPNGTRLLTGSNDGTAKVWDAKTGVEVVTLKGHRNGVKAACWNPDGTRVLTAGDDYIPKLGGNSKPDDQTVRVWDPNTGNEVLVLKGHTRKVVSACWSPDGTRVFTGSNDQTARVWDTRIGSEVLTLKDHDDYVHAAVWSPNGRRVLTGGADNTARVWDANTGKEVLTLKGHRNGVTAVCWSQNGTQLLTGSDDGTAKVWDAKSGALALTLKGHTGRVNAVSWNPDCTRVVTASNDKTARVWDARTGKVVLTLKGHSGWVYAASWSPDGIQVVTCSADNTAKVWDAQTGDEVLALVGHTDGVGAACWSPDGTQILTACSDGTAMVWDGRTGAEVFVLKGHTGNVVHAHVVHGASWSPDGTRALIGSWDGVVNVWDARTGAELLTLKAHTGPVSAVSWDPDGAWVLTGSWDGTVKVWGFADAKREK